MTRGAAWFVRAAALLAGGSGLLWGYCAYLWEPGPEPLDPELLLEWTGLHPWTPLVRTAHLFAVPLLVFALGLVWHGHVAPRLWRPWARRVTGLPLALIFPPMALSGVALQTATSAAARDFWVWTHGVTSGAWVLLFLVHLVGVRRGRRGTDGS